MKRKSIRCVVFDMDGTLTQTNQLIFDSFNHVTEKYAGKHLTPEEVVALFGPPEREAVAKVVGAADLDRAMVDYYAFYDGRHDELASSYAGIPELLEDLWLRGTTIGLFTGKGSTTTNITLRHLGLAQYFHIVMTGDDVTQHKPSGDGLRQIMDRFTLASDELLMVGDSVADIRAARDAGVQIASVLWDSYSRTRVLETGSDHVFERVADFHSWISGQLEKGTI